MNTEKAMITQPHFQTITTSLTVAERSIPPVPVSEFHRMTIQYLEVLPARDRGRFRLAAVTLAAVGILGTTIWMFSGFSWWLLLGMAGFVAGSLAAFWLSPAHIEALICQIERDAQRRQDAYADQCAVAVNAMAAQVADALRADARASLRSGCSFRDLCGELLELKDELEKLGDRELAEAAQHRDRVVQITAENKKRRERFMIVSSGLIARLFPIYRSEAKAIIHGIKAVHESACAEARLLASSTQFNVLSATSAKLQTQIESVLKFDVDQEHQTQDLLGTALGSPLPTRMELETAAAERVDRNLTELRLCVLERLLEGKSPLSSVKQSILEEFSVDPRWAKSVESYVSSLPSPGAFADVFWLEGNEQLPVRTKPGKTRFRVALLIGPKPTSTCYQAIASRCKDVSAIASTEHCPEELLGIPVEVNITISEVPELLSIVEEFRAMPLEAQRKLITATPYVDKLLTFFPERSARGNHSEGLLDSAVAMEVVVRDGSGQLAFNGVVFAKGYAGARKNLRDDRDLADKIESAVRRKCDSLGADEVRRILVKAKSESPVPESEKVRFREHMEAEIARLSAAAERVAA